MFSHHHKHHFSHNRYSYPLCPLCDSIGNNIESDIKKCSHDGCQVDEYWLGGYTLHDHSFYRPESDTDIPIHAYHHAM